MIRRVAMWTVAHMILWGFKGRKHEDNAAVIERISTGLMKKLVGMVNRGRKGRRAGSPEDVNC